MTYGDEPQNPIAPHRSPGARSRFLQEARTAAGLSHPNIVPIHLVTERTMVTDFSIAIDDLTVQINRAHEIGKAVDRKLGADEEVRKMLGDG